MMVDYYSPTVIEPELPDCDMTPLEQLVLGHIFEVKAAGDGYSYFFSENGPDETPEIEAVELRHAYEASKGFVSILTEHVGELLAQHDAMNPEDRSEFVGIDAVDSVVSKDQILQGIVVRSTTIDEIVVTTSWTCSKMHSDAFGGSITRITAGNIQYRSTCGMLEEMRNQGTVEALRIVLDLAKQNVIADDDISDQAKCQREAIALIEHLAVNEYGTSKS